MSFDAMTAINGASKSDIEEMEGLLDASVGAKRRLLFAIEVRPRGGSNAGARTLFIPETGEYFNFGGTLPSGNAMRAKALSRFALGGVENGPVRPPLQGVAK